ncbi:SUMF1/EgtB/PvdO family nonheme iron enzyme [Ursidibacter arcticus]|uniref:SUMF1/EgtB/PvdO family nonheme iron enzyme n=1 Tax=Ursidibacter arcticus TaxID=1524965 RepID=UPI001F07525B|nr:SUMF1/EgtB/PvdO family nonheme iron enzyme [Ursidibacter arcticus]KAE9535385.1 sulfatase [Ursidibacter arcticus]
MTYNTQKWVALGLGLFTTVAEAAWEEKFFNPKPLADDVILPMPCDGSMVFRVIKTNTNKPLDDTKITLGGNSNEEDNYAQYATPAYIAGSFSDQSKERYFLIGKYEVTEAQYNAVMKGEQCTAPNMKGVMPITNVSWFDAVEFSRKYSEWLLKNAADKLPVEDGAKGFVRLPTNVEWEYASRGGAAVDPGVFRENTFPMPDGFNNYAWSSKSANGKLQLIGRLSPNPLGLFDTLGNVSEMVFDSFQANKLDRYHGQEGGIIVRGGSYIKPESEVDNVSRIEIPYYDANGATKKRDMGFRLVVTAPLLTSSERIKMIRQEWSALGSGGKDKNDTNIVDKLEKLASNVEDDKLKNEINKTKEELRASNQARDEQRDAAARSSLQLGAFLCANISDLEAVVEREKIAIQSFEEGLNAEQDPELKQLLEQKRESFKLKLAEAEKARDYVLNYYTSTITATFDTYSQNTIEAQIDRTKKIMGEKRLANGEKAVNITQYIDLYWSHLSQYYKNGQIGRDKWLKQCTEIKQQN